jgi:hypothetical protein
MLTMAVTSDHEKIETVFLGGVSTQTYVTPAFKYSRAAVFTYSVSAVYRGPEKKLHIKEINGS